MLELNEIDISDIQAVSNSGENPQVICSRCKCIEKAKDKGVRITEQMWLSAATSGGWRSASADTATYKMACSTCIVELYEAHIKKL